MLAAASALHGETWQTNRGPVTGDVTAVIGPQVILAQKRGTAYVPVESLGDADVGRLADWLAAHPATPTRWKDSTSKVAKALASRLEVLSDGKFVRFDPGDRPEPELYVVYFGALWCGPCRRFSPGFVQKYHELRRLGGTEFEVVFVSSDHDRDDQLEYVKEANMPWPVLQFKSVGSVPTIERWAGRGIPCLVVLTREGQVLFHTYRGDDYLGPDHTLGELQQFLVATHPANPRAKRALHRLAVAQHLRRGNAPLQPYLVALDPKRYQTIEANELTVTLSVDPTGKVTDSTFEPKQTAVIADSLAHDAAEWLFLPKVKDGVAVATQAALPVKLRASP